MFKFIHAADIHLDSPLRGLANHEAAPVDSIRGACRKAFENLIDRAIEEQVAFVLLAGDIYDGDWKDYSTGIFLSRQIGRLGQHNIAVFAVAGNHDAANRMTKALDNPVNMTTFSSRKAETVRLDELGVAIHGRSFATQHVHENLTAGYARAEPGLFNIGLLHTSLNGREGHAPYAPCSVDDLCAKGYDYWALGHVHQREYIAQDPWIVFPGCIQGRHIRETGDKGCVLVTVAEGMVNEVEALPLDVVRWALCCIDLTGAVDMPEVLERSREAINNAVLAAEGRTLAMRIRLEGSTLLADNLAAHPERWQQQLHALGAEVAGDELWIERVENKVNRRLNLDEALAEDNVLARLLSDILTTTDYLDDIAGVQPMITELLQKIPAEVFHTAGHEDNALAAPGPAESSEATGSTDHEFTPDSPQALERLLQEARGMLVGRLLAAEAVK